MRTHDINTDTEHEFLIAMITSTNFVKRIIPIYRDEYMESPAATRIVGWCIEHFNKYNTAPGADIQSIFEERRRRMREEDEEWISKFLGRLSRRFEEQGVGNEEYLFDRSVRMFKRQKMQRSAEEVLHLVDDGKDEEAEKIWLDSMHIPESDDLGVDPFDPRVIKKLNEQEEHRATLKLGIETLDDMVGPTKSGWLAVFLGPMKRGKTMALIHVAMRGVMKGYDVVFCSLETEVADMARRFWQNMGPFSTTEKRVKVPRFLKGKVVMEEYDYDLIERTHVIHAAWKLRKATPGRLRLKTFPMGTAGVKEIRNYLNLLEVYEGFAPHLIIVDYLGAMKSPSRLESRDTEYNHNSMMLKAIAQERKAMVFTAHQGTRDTLDKITMKASDASQEVRIIANLDVMWGLNQRVEEKEEGQMRINVLMHRHRKFTPMLQAKVLQQFEIGQFVLDDIPITQKDAHDEVGAIVLKHRKQEESDEQQGDPVSENKQGD